MVEMVMCLVLKVTRKGYPLESFMYCGKWELHIVSEWSNSKCKVKKKKKTTGLNSYCSVIKKGKVF